jgi:hypothetical protein
MTPPALRTPAVEGLMLVFAGSFNPRIFDPWWFVREGLIQEDEAKNAEIGVMTSNLTVFSIGWLRVHAENERVQLTASQSPYYEPLRDLALATFKILRHTPLKALGIHWLAHFASRDKDEWHKVGHALAPKEIWNEVLNDPGLLHLVIREKPEGKNWTNVTVEPSLKVEPGIYFEVHEHYEVEDSKMAEGTESIIGILQKRWSESSERASRIMQHVLTKTLDGDT